MSSVTISLENFDRIMSEIDKMGRDAQKVIDRTLGDFRQRGPGWVSQEVVKEYNIKKGELNSKDVGRVKVKGNTAKDVNITYYGRVLTPVHFGMNPKAPKSRYKLTVAVKKGQKKTWGTIKPLTKEQRKNVGRNFTKQGTKSSGNSPNMLMGTGNTKVDGVDWIPFQRIAFNRKMVHVRKTVSLPQMVSNEEVKENIYKAIDEKLGKRFDHHVERYLGK